MSDLGRISNIKNFSSVQHNWERGPDLCVRAAHWREGLLLRPGEPSHRRLRHAAQGYHGSGQ